MIKAILLFLAVLSPSYLSAQSEVCSSSATLNVVAVASHTATNLDNSARRMSDRKYLEVQNISTNTVTCDFKSSVTNGSGRVIAASGSWEMSLKDTSFVVAISSYSPMYVSSSTAMGIWCTSNGTNVTSNVAFIQCR